MIFGKRGFPLHLLQAALFTMGAVPLRRPVAVIPPKGAPKLYRAKPSRYMPHQGVRECERRKRTAIRTFAKHVAGIGPINLDEF